MEKIREYLKNQIAEAKAKNDNIILQCYIETHEEDDTISYLDSNGEFKICLVQYAIIPRQKYAELIEIQKKMEDIENGRN